MDSAALAMLPEILPSIGRLGAGIGPLDGVPDLEHPRRPAGGAVRPRLPRSGRGQEHLRHRMLPPDAHRRLRPSPPPTACSPLWPSKVAGQPPYLCLGRIGRHGRRHQSSGYVTSLASSTMRPRSRPWPAASTTTVTCTSCPHSPACSPPTGAPTREGAVVGLTQFRQPGAPGSRRVGGNRVSDSGSD